MLFVIFIVSLFVCRIFVQWARVAHCYFCIISDVCIIFQQDVIQLD